MDRHIRAGVTALAATATLLLASCFLSPGKFDSALDLRKDGRFTFTYTGQIYLLALGQLADMAKDAKDGETFTPQCFDDKAEKRQCTSAEAAEQRKAWDAGAEERKQKAQKDNEAMKAMLGGIDPADPQAAQELADRLRRQRGWKRVDYRGNGLFDVDFAISSQLSHDFVFPTFERFPMTDAFVLAHARQDRQVRIDAPGFSAQSTTGNPFAAMAAMGETGSKDAAAKMPFPDLDGTFRIITDGKILANNTDEGPRAGPGGQTLSWRITKRTPSAPTALIDLGS